MVYWEGALGANLAVPPLLLAWVRAEGAGIGRGVAREHGYSTWSRQNSVAPVKLDLPRFASASARRNARKNSKFDFSKFSSLGAHHIGQGTQAYFCCSERLSFAKIYISNLMWLLFQIQTLAQV
jgi:hypothetical protein